MPTRVRSLVRSVFSPSVAGSDDRPDGELVARFLSQHDEAAFELLVRRHGPMVRAVCRAELRNPADADDAFQATFLVLVRRAGAIRDRAAVGAWLYSVAGRVARKLRSQARVLPPLPDDLPQRDAPDTAFDTRAVLDEEIARLPEPYRLVVQACYVAGHTTSEAATRLGWAKGTVLTRLAWARKQLRKRLTARGLSLAIGAFGTQLSQPAANAVSWALIEATTRAALGFVTRASVIPERPLTLSDGVIRAMTMDKMKWVAGAVLAAAVLTGVGVGRWSADALGNDGQAKNAKATTPPANTAPLRPPTSELPRDPLVPSGVLPSPDPLVTPPPSARNSTVPPLPSPTPISSNLPLPTTIPPQNIPAANTTPVSAGKTYIVARPVGTWGREVQTSDSDNFRITTKFEEDRLTIRLTSLNEKQPVEVMIEGDYSITRDSVVYGIVTSYDMLVPPGPNAPQHEDDLTDQLFTFRFRVDNGVLTLRDFKMPGVKDGIPALIQALNGRFTTATEQPTPPAGPKKLKSTSVLPRRGPAVVPPTNIPPTVSPGTIFPSGAGVIPAPGLPVGSN